MMGVFIQVENGVYLSFGFMGGNFFVFFPAPNVFLSMFTSSSQDVLQVPNVFPIIPHFKWHIVLPWLNMNINCKGGAKGKHDKACVYLGEGSIFNWGVPDVPKIMVMCQSNGSFWKKRKKTPSLTKHE